MKKRSFAAMVLLSLLLILTACGCGKMVSETAGDKVSETAGETAAAQETTTVTEPTLSQEERLIASLPDKVMQAWEEGIVDLAMLEDLDRNITTDEVTTLMQRIYSLHFDEETVVLKQASNSTLMGREATRHWLALLMYAPLAERLYGAAPYETFEESIQWLTVDAVGHVQIDGYFIQNGMVLVMENNPAFYHYDSPSLEKDGILGYTYGSSSKGYDDLLGPVDLLEYWDDKWDEEMTARAQSEGWIEWLDYGFHYVQWTNLAADRFTGEKLLGGDLNTPFGPREKMTVREAVEAALRYYHFIQPEGQRYLYAEVPTYDTALIPSELLTKQTDLPEADCSALPREWKGITMQNLLFGEENGMPDNRIQANELDIIQQAGFNYLEICFDFRALIHESYLTFAWQNEPVDGCMSETKLKDLDQILAMCMERDIHVNLSCVGVGGWNQNQSVSLGNASNAKLLAQQWAALARRYADIPNTYLSFTIFRDPGIFYNKAYATFFAPVVEAIRGESPERCIIANVSRYMRELPAAMAELGVAISCEAALRDDFAVDHYSTPRDQWDRKFQESQWPYVSGKETYDAEGAMNNFGSNIGLSLDACAQMAQEYGVGFMVSNWDAASSDRKQNQFRQRYTDEMMYAYLTDFANVLESRGWGWCYGNWDGYVGLVYGYPALDTTTYTQVENVSVYVDNKMMAWFQEINQAQ